jgi:hypothetical protein
MSADAAPAIANIGFPAAISKRAKRRLGIAGRTCFVRLVPGGFEIAGGESGRVTLPFARIARIRAGFEETKSGTILLLRLWRVGERGTVTFGGNEDRRAYGRFVRAAVPRLMQERPDLPIETGSGWFVPIFAIGAFGALSLAASGFMLYLAVTGDDWRIGLGALAVALILLAVLGPWVWSRHRPRRIARAEEIERALPGC